MTFGPHCKMAECYVRLKVKSVVKPSAHSAGAYHGFFSMKWLEVSPLPPSWMGYLPAFHQASQTICQYQFILLGQGERDCEWKGICPRTQHNDLARSRTQTPQPRVQCANHYVTVSPWVLPQICFAFDTSLS